MNDYEASEKLGQEMVDLCSIHPVGRVLSVMFSILIASVSEKSTKQNWMDDCERVWDSYQQLKEEKDE